MSLFIASLNSGSNGNCYYVGNEEEAVLIDAGISCRETERRLLRLGLDKSKIKAIVITHEHSDHINGLYQLVKKNGWPVYITPGTLAESRIDLSLYVVHTFDAGKIFHIGRLAIKAFQKFHDAADPHSVVVECNDVRVGVFTDIGVVCPQVIEHFNTCHAVFLESNYDEEMLEKGPYPYHLKRRIRGGKGHISNKQAIQLFKDHRSAFLSHLILSHLSQQNNDPHLVQHLFSAEAEGTRIVVASRTNESEVFHIQNTNHTFFSPLKEEFTQAYFPPKKAKKVMNENQLSLF